MCAAPGSCFGDAHLWILTLVPLNDCSGSPFSSCDRRSTFTGCLVHGSERTSKNMVRGPSTSRGLWAVPGYYTVHVAHTIRLQILWRHLVVSCGILLSSSPFHLSLHSFSRLRRGTTRDEARRRSAQEGATKSRVLRTPGRTVQKTDMCMAHPLPLGMRSFIVFGGPTPKSARAHAQVPYTI